MEFTAAERQPVIKLQSRKGKQGLSVFQPDLFPPFKAITPVWIHLLSGIFTVSRPSDAVNTISSCKMIDA
jgi:hypothetical protein